MSGVTETPLVLVVDDDAGTRLLARSALEGGGLRVIEAADGAEALETLQRVVPDLVLLDFNLPQVDGVTVCNRIRASEETEHTPVMMVTSNDDLDSIDRAFAAGATDFVTKPVQWRVLVTRVRFVLRARRAMRELSENRKQLAEAQRIAKVGSWSLTGESLSLSEEARRVFGIDAHAEVTRRRLFELIDPADAARIERTLERAEATGEPFSAEFRIDFDGGRTVQVFGEVVGRSAVRGTIQDVTSQVEAEARIRHLAYHDELTGLGNRTWFTERVGHAIDLAGRAGRKVGVMFLDLDEFKAVNDTLGHSAGDQLLREVAARLRSLVRVTDSVAREPDREPSTSLSRIGGDEFTVLLENMRAPVDLSRVARRIQDELPRPFGIGGYEFSISASMGLAMWPDDGSDCETLLRKADTAMYQAKRRGRNLYHFSVDAVNDSTLERLTLETKLRRASALGQLTADFQPLVNATTGETVAVEALARWRLPDTGFIAPDVFIPMAEETGAIGEIGRHIFESACRSLAGWHALGFSGLRATVNISPQQLTRDLPAELNGCAERHGLRAENIELELTETALLREDEVVSSTMQELKDLGFTLALDDFGTGYSSLRFLQQFSVDVVKIDRSFVHGLEADSEAQALVRAILRMAGELGLETVAEGVETARQADVLREFGCALLQGYYFSKPLPADEVAGFLQNRRARS